MFLFYVPSPHFFGQSQISPPFTWREVSIESDGLIYWYEVFDEIESIGSVQSAPVNIRVT